MYFTLKMLSGKWGGNIRILIKFYIFWFYSQCPSSFWLSYSSTESSIINNKHMYDLFSFGIFYPENLYLLYLNIILFLSLCICCYHHKKVHYQILYSLNSKFFHILMYFFNSFLSMTLKYIVLCYFQSI